MSYWATRQLLLSMGMDKNELDESLAIGGLLAIVAVGGVAAGHVVLEHRAEHAWSTAYTAEAGAGAPARMQDSLAWAIHRDLGPEVHKAEDMARRAGDNTYLTKYDRFELGRWKDLAEVVRHAARTGASGTAYGAGMRSQIDTLVMRLQRAGDRVAAARHDSWHDAGARDRAGELQNACAAWWEHRAVEVPLAHTRDAAVDLTQPPVLLGTSSGPVRLAGGATARPAVTTDAPSTAPARREPVPHLSGARAAAAAVRR